MLVEKAPLAKPVKSLVESVLDGSRFDTVGMMLGVVTARHFVLTRNGHAGNLRKVNPRHLAISHLIKLVPRPRPAQKHEQHAPPDVGGCILAKPGGTWVGKFAKPDIQRIERLDEGEKFLGDKFRVHTLFRFATERLAAKPRTIPRDWDVPSRMICLRRLYSFVHCLTSATSSIGT